MNNDEVRRIEITVNRDGFENFTDIVEVYKTMDDDGIINKYIPTSFQEDYKLWVERCESLDKTTIESDDAYAMLWEELGYIVDPVSVYAYVRF